MTRFALGLFAGGLLAFAAVAAEDRRAFAQTGGAVDLELVLAVDSSGSIDEEELALQRGGWATAFLTNEVLGAIRSGRHQAIAVMFLEWAATGCETISVGWTRLSDAASASAFADRIMNAERLYCPGGNAIGDAVSFATRQIHSNDFQGERLVIDVSGDGPNTLGGPVEAAREQAVATGITVNGLALLTRRSFGGPYGLPLDDYYRTSVIGGPGAFVMTAKKEDEASFRQAVRAKLVREIAALPADPRASGHAAAEQ